MRESRHEMLIAFYQGVIAQRCLEGREPGWRPMCAHCGKDLGRYAGLVVFEHGKPLSLCPEHRDEYQPTEEIIEYYMSPEEAKKIRERDALADRWTVSLARNMREYKEEILSAVWAKEV